MISHAPQTRGTEAQELLYKRKGYSCWQQKGITLSLVLHHKQQQTTSIQVLQLAGADYRTILRLFQLFDLFQIFLTQISTITSDNKWKSLRGKKATHATH